MAGRPPCSAWRGLSPPFVSASTPCAPCSPSFDRAEVLEQDDSLNLWRGIGEVTPLVPLTTPLWRVSIPAAQAPALVGGARARGAG